MSYTSSEQHVRHAYVDQVVGSAVALVNSDPNVNAAVGPEVVAHMNDLAANYFVPNLRHGVVDLSAEQQSSDGYAIAAVNCDDQIRLSHDFARFAPNQHDNAQSYLGELGLSELETDAKLEAWQSCMRHNAVVFAAGRSLAKRDADATVTAHALQVELPGHVAATVRARELLMLGLPLSDEKPLPESGVVHENLHQVLVRWKPVREIPTIPFGLGHMRLIEEQVAFGLDAAVIRAKQLGGYTLTAEDRGVLLMPGTIGTIREYAQTNNMDPSVLFDSVRSQDIQAIDLVFLRFLQQKASSLRRDS